MSSSSLAPVIDVGPLVTRTLQRARVAEQIDAACKESGFFYAVGRGIDESLCRNLESLSRWFFEQSDSVKMQIAMSRGGRARRIIPLSLQVTRFTGRTFFRKFPAFAKPSWTILTRSRGSATR